MQLIYDNDADALEVALRDGIVSHTIEIDSGTLVDVDEHGVVVALEVIQPNRPWPLDEIFDRFAIDEVDAELLRALQVRQGETRTAAAAAG